MTLCLYIEREGEGTDKENENENECVVYVFVLAYIHTHACKVCTWNILTLVIQNFMFLAEKAWMCLNSASNEMDSFCHNTAYLKVEFLRIYSRSYC